MRPSYLNNLLSPINLVTGIGPKIENYSIELTLI